MQDNKILTALRELSNEEFQKEIDKINTKREQDKDNRRKSYEKSTTELKEKIAALEKNLTEEVKKLTHTVTDRTKRDGITEKANAEKMKIQSKISETESSFKIDLESIDKKANNEIQMWEEYKNPTTLRARFKKETGVSLQETFHKEAIARINGIEEDVIVFKNITTRNTVNCTEEFRSIIENRQDNSFFSRLKKGDWSSKESWHLFFFIVSVIVTITILQRARNLSREENQLREIHAMIVDTTHNQMNTVSQGPLTATEISKIVQKETSYRQAIQEKKIIEQQLSVLKDSLGYKQSKVIDSINQVIRITTTYFAQQKITLPNNINQESIQSFVDSVSAIYEKQCKDSVATLTNILKGIDSTTNDPIEVLQAKLDSLKNAKIPEKYQPLESRISNIDFDGTVVWFIEIIFIAISVLLLIYVLASIADLVKSIPEKRDTSNRQYTYRNLRDIAFSPKMSHRRECTIKFLNLSQKAQEAKTSVTEGGAYSLHAIIHDTAFEFDEAGLKENEKVPIELQKTAPHPLLFAIVDDTVCAVYAGIDEQTAPNIHTTETTTAEENKLTKLGTTLIEEANDAKSLDTLKKLIAGKETCSSILATKLSSTEQSFITFTESIGGLFNAVIENMYQLISIQKTLQLDMYKHSTTSPLDDGLKAIKLQLENQRDQLHEVNEKVTRAFGESAAQFALIKRGDSASITAILRKLDALKSLTDLAPNLQAKSTYDLEG